MYGAPFGGEGNMSCGVSVCCTLVCITCHELRVSRWQGAVDVPLVACAGLVLQVVLLRSQASAVAASPAAALRVSLVGVW